MSKRICEVCGCEVKYTGYVVEAGLEYYCSTKCLHKVYSPKEWRKMYTDGGDNYYTQWDDDDEEDNT